ncbi:MAG: SGNH/GDSL hydrolase family protein [Paludibacter sp.]
MKTKFYFTLTIAFICTSIFAKPLFKNNDKVCFMGNSITHGGRYHSYIYLYYATRFPEIKLSFINCGISGDVASSMYDRLEKDIYANNATVATLSVGMNDVNRGLYSSKKPVANADSLKKKAIENYKKNVTKIADSYRDHHVKSIFLTPTIYEESEAITTENLKGVNAALGECRDFVLKLGKEYNATVVDFWKPMFDLDTRMQQKDPNFTIVGKDRVHPGLTGHMVMAYQFLTQTNAPKEVWTLTIDSKKKTAGLEQNCKVSDLKIKPGNISFQNKEMALPFPKVKAAKEAYDLVPITDNLNQQILKIRQLEAGNYRLKINSIEVGSYSNSDFEKGINLATNTKTPQYAIADSIAKLVEEDFAKQYIIRTYRFIELKKMSKVNYANRDTAKAFLRKFIEEMHLQKNNPEAYSSYWVMSAQTYIDEIDNEQKMKGRIKEIEELIYTLNKPQTFSYVIEKI